MRRALLILLGLLAAALSPALPAHALSTTVSPDVAPPGYTFNFAPNEIVHVVFQTPSGAKVRYADSGGIDIPVYADGGGRASWSYTTPSSFADGVYVAVAAGLKNNVTQRIAFLIQAGAPARDLSQPNETGTVSVRPEIGAPGAIFVFRTDGYQPRERVAIWIHAPDGGLSDLTVDMGHSGDRFADQQGHLEWVVTTRRTTPDGTYVAVAVGTASNTLRVASFVVQQGAGQVAPAPTPDTFVSPTSGPPGTSFAFTATGFLPGEGIGIWIHKPDGQILTITADGSAVHADATGIAKWSITANKSLADGVYTMVAEGISSTTVRAVRFEIRR